MQRKFESRNAMFALIIGSLLLVGRSQVQVRHDGTEKKSKSSSASKILDNPAPKIETDDFEDEQVPTTPSTAAPIAIGGTEKEVAPKRVAVILGPGGYKTFAHAAVLKELIKNDVPIHKIVGIEWGALVAGLYAQRGQVNEAEWKLYKIEKLDFGDGGFFSTKKGNSSLKALEKFLDENLNSIDVNKATVPYFCPSLSLAQGAQTWQDRGPLAKAVLKCMAYPPLFKPYNDSVAALFSVTDTISKLKSEGYNVVLLVNVLGDGNLFDKSVAKDDYATAIVWAEARREIWRAKSLATDVVDVNTRGVSILDLESGKLLVTAGEAAGERGAKQLATKYGF